MDSIKKYLSELRKNETFIFENDIKSIIERRKEQLKIDSAQTDKYLEYFSSKGYIEIMEDYYNNYIKALFISKLSTNVQEKIRDIYIGILPTYKANASAIKCPDGRPIIILHSQLLTMVTHYNEMQMIFGKLIQGNHMNEAKILLRDISKEICLCFIYHNYLPKMSLLPTTLDSKEFLLAHSKADLQMLFIIAHELAHIYLEHLNNTVSEELCMAEGNVKIENYIRNQKCELEADALAIQWIIDAVLKEDDEHHLLRGAHKNSSYMSLEIFMMYHMIEINTSRYKVDSKELEMELSQHEFNNRFYAAIKELDELLLSNTCLEFSNHPRAIIRLINLISINIERFDKLGAEFLIGMLHDVLYYGIFKFESLI